MILKASFNLPPGFLPAFGYRRGRRFVALYWEPSGDEACYDDGISSACGCCDNWLFLDFVRLPDIRKWLDENGVCLGSSDEQARHWMVVDSQAGAVYTAPVGEASRILRTQSIPELK